MTQPDACRLYTPRRFNATTRQRFYRSRKMELAKHCGGTPSRTQQILIARIVSNEWHLYRLDARLDAGELSDHAMRSRFAMENRLRLDLRDLGLKGADPKTPTLAEHLARKAAEKAASQPEGAAA